MLGAAFRSLQLLTKSSSLSLKCSRESFTWSKVSLTLKQQDSYSQFPQVHILNKHSNGWLLRTRFKLTHTLRKQYGGLYGYPIVVRLPKGRRRDCIAVHSPILFWKNVVNLKGNIFTTLHDLNSERRIENILI